MRKGVPDPRTFWSTWEVVLRHPDGRKEYPVADALFSGEGDEYQSALQKMRLVQAHGWPGARLALKDKKGKSLIDRADEDNPKLYILKCKPRCWRLYFYVDPDQRRFVYLYAVCKRWHHRDPGDSAAARTVFDSIRPGGSAIAEFTFKP